MTDNEIRTEIAKHDNSGGPIPDYPNDSNAIIKVIEELPYEQLQVYVRKLGFVLCDSENRNDWDYVSFAVVYPRQQAEAFLRTIGKWKD